MKKEENKNGVSLFSQSDYLINDDPLEEIFALNLGDFISEHLISEDLAKKIGTNVKDKKNGLINQLKELISIYSMQNTLCVLNFNSKEKHAIFTSISHAILQMLEVENCGIFLEKNNTLELSGSTSEFDFNFETLNEAFKEQETIINGNFIAIPMHSNIKSVGVIALKTNNALRKAYIELVESIGILLATSITLQSTVDEANRLIEDENSNITDLQHIRAELTALIGDLCDYQQEFVENLAKAVDKKDQYIVSHSKNTANLAKEICRELGLNEKTTDLIYYAGLLQNIGKICLSEKIFATNGKLSLEELKKVQEHSNLGVQLLMNINFLSEVVPYITYQKERIDGSGAPEGLKGQSIPFGSRIIAVADSYCAMTSDRPYRKAIPTDEVLKIMQKEAGTKWDVDVINTLTKIRG